MSELQLGRNETPNERADRRRNEPLQEVRVAQTGPQTAPVAYHRLLAGRRLKPQLIDATGRVVTHGVVLNDSSNRSGDGSGDGSGGQQG
ncbi:DUF6328 family protein [Kitasatospora phosalacinea]|uniref:Uncharacterized protein n=1 Tax=Kitasatospora phosalacinea TaxID=2065 RepID=A0A9W6PM09_9ACTN|nr:DUF6328 family protein [Kitasatospora phosalacinea]GLW57334.1 hypothetical protein Kpho01_53450 [Kitasatospora phosalacinea]